MFGAVVIVFREVLEAGLIIGVVLAATKGIPDRGRWVALGVGLGFVGACGVAAGAGWIGRLFHGSGQELLNASVLFAAVAMLAWHNVWMSTHGREMAREARKLGNEISRGNKSLIAMTGVVGVAVLREGSEVALFLYGLLASQGGTWLEVLAGGTLGLLLGAIAATLLYFGLLSIPLRYFFSATAVLITFLAAGLAARGVAFLQQGGYLESGSSPLWDTSAYLPEGGWLGRLLQTLVGYSDQPSGMQVAFYFFTLCGIMGWMRLVSSQSKQ